MKSEKVYEIYLVRNKDNSLVCYPSNPIDVDGKLMSLSSICFEIDRKHFPEITSNNSPKKANIIIEVENLEDQPINPETLRELQFDEEKYINNSIYTKYYSDNSRLIITFQSDVDAISIEYYIEEDKLIFLFETNKFTINKLKEVLRLCNLKYDL